MMNESHNATDSVQLCENQPTSTKTPENFDTLLYTVNGPVTAVLVAVGMLLNSVCIGVFSMPVRKPAQRPAINYYLFTLAVWDVALLAGALLLYCYPTLYSGTFTFSMGNMTYLMPFVYYLAQTTLSGTVWVIVALTIDRYIALCYPLMHNNMDAVKIKRLLVAVSVAALVYALPNLFVVDVIVVDCAMLQTDGNRIISFEARVIENQQLKDSYMYNEVYKIWCSLLLYSLIPFIMLFVLTVRISYAIHKATNLRRTMSMTPNASRSVLLDSQRSSTVNRLSIVPEVRRRPARSHQAGNIMLMTVVLKFLVCRLLITVVDVGLHSVYDTELIAISNLLVVINASTNFIVYVAFSLSFRDSVVQLLTGRHRTHDHPEHTVSVLDRSGATHAVHSSRGTRSSVEVCSAINGASTRGRRATSTVLYNNHIQSPDNTHNTEIVLSTSSHHLMPPTTTTPLTTTVTCTIVQLENKRFEVFQSDI